MRLNFQAAPTNMVMWNLQIKILYMLGHTDNDKDRLQHPEHQIWLALTQFQFHNIMEKILKMSGVLRSNCCETCRNIPQKTPVKEFIKKNSLTRQINKTDHRLLRLRLIDHRPNDSLNQLIMLERLDNRNMFVLQNTSTAGKTYSYTSVYYPKSVLISIKHIRRSQLYWFF